MAWEVEYTDEFEVWWIGLDEEEQIDIAAVVGLKIYEQHLKDLKNEQGGSP